MKDVSKGFLNVLTLKILSDSFSFYSFLLNKLKQYLRLQVWSIQEKLVVHEKQTQVFSWKFYLKFELMGRLRYIPHLIFILII